MATSSNQHTMPSLAQLERLAILMEEAAEVQQVIGKIIRHGWRNGDPANGGYCNRIALEHELGDLSWAIVLLMEAGDVEEAAITRFYNEKPAKAAAFLHHQEVR